MDSDVGAFPEALPELPFYLRGEFVRFVQSDVSVHTDVDFRRNIIADPARPEVMRIAHSWNGSDNRKDLILGLEGK